MNMQSLRQPSDPPRYFPTIDAFFDWSDGQAEAYELVDGVPRLLPWVKLNHARIVTNLLTLVASRIDRDVHEVTAGDFAVQVNETSLRFADLMVFPAGKSGGIRTVRDAVLLVEVLSESTAHVDFGAKLHEYQALEALSSYVIIDQDAVRVWHWAREQNGKWPAAPIALADDRALSLSLLGLDLPLADIYRGVN